MTSALRRFVVAVSILAGVAATPKPAVAQQSSPCELGCLGGFLACIYIVDPGLCQSGYDGCIYGCAYGGR
jgi:hypothetical protein